MSHLSSDPNHDHAAESTGHVATDTDPGGTDQEFDGIRQQDHPIPGWWSGLFVATVLFAFPYFVFYHGGAEGRTLDDHYSIVAAENARLQFAEIGELEGDATTLAKYMDDSSWLRVGESVFASHCVSCHGGNGGGLVGPNLTDDAYKNVRSIEDLYTVVKNGAAAGAMPPWQGRLEQNEMVLVAAYAAALRGTDPGPGAKAPEGQEIAPWPEYVEPEVEQGESDAADAAEAE